MASKLPRVLPVQELKNQQKAFTEKSFNIPLCDAPSDRYLELREDQIRTEYKAEELGLATTAPLINRLDFLRPKF